MMLDSESTMARLPLLLLSAFALGSASPLNLFEQIETFYRIEYHNANPARTYNMSYNHISAMSREAFNRTLGFRLPKVLPFTKPFVVAENFKAPDSVDWREQDIVSPVKDQGTCGSCWAFSAVGALEGQHAKKKGEMVQFSEQNLVDCSRGYGNNGCDGGLMDNAFKYINENGGIDTEKSYPYENKDDDCKFKKDAVGETDEGFVDLPRGDEEALKNAVATIGPISVGIQVTANFQHYSGGVFYDEECDGSLNHGVLVVGYGTDEALGDYWLVKNSWSEKFGEAGYIRMARNRRNNCGIATFASYPIVE